MYRRALWHSASKERFGEVYLRHRLHRSQSCHPRKPLLKHVQLTHSTQSFTFMKVNHFIIGPYTY